MPGVTLTVGLRAELLEILGMVRRRSGSPLLALCADRFERAIERRGAPASGPIQLALWEFAAAPESRADAAGSPPQDPNISQQASPAQTRVSPFSGLRG